MSYPSACMMYATIEQYISSLLPTTDKTPTFIHGHMTYSYRHTSLCSCLFTSWYRLQHLPYTGFHSLPFRTLHKSQYCMKGAYSPFPEQQSSHLCGSAWHMFLFSQSNPKHLLLVLRFCPSTHPAHTTTNTNSNTECIVGIHNRAIVIVFGATVLLFFSFLFFSISYLCLLHS